MRRRKNRLGASLFVLCILAVDGSAHALEEADDFRERISTIQGERSPDRLRTLISDLGEMGARHKDADYYRSVVELCEALNASSNVYPDGAELAWRLATNALDSPGDKPLDAEVALLPFTRYDPYYTKQSPRGAEWQTDRLRRLQRWVGTWNRVQSEKKNLPSTEGPFKFNVWPPRGSGPVRMGGADPAKIEDPAARKMYEDARAANAEKARIHRLKGEIEDLEREFIYPAKCYAIEAYSQPPFNTAELERTLKGSGLSEAFQAEVVNEVKQNEGAQAEQTARAKPQVVKYTEASPPGTAVYHPDVRLRKLVTFTIAAPKVDDVLEKLRAGTGVPLTRATEIQSDYPAAGSLSFTGVPAWQIMDLLAASKYVEGRWEKDGDGYRLVRNGNPVAPPEIIASLPVQPSPGWQRAVRLFGIALTTAIIGVLVFLLIRRKRLATH